MYDLGSRIKKIRKQRGLTQKMLSQRINKSTAAISSYESNTQLPPLDVFESIASVLNVSLDYLSGFADNSFYSLKTLTKSQREIIDLLLAEFITPTSGDNKNLSIQQVQIIQRIIVLFTNTT